MKAILLILLVPIIVCSSFFAKAQQPGLQGFNYQALARVQNGDPLRLQAIQVRFSILAGSTTGNPLYVERQFTTTNSQGLFSLIVGSGSPELGSFSNIPWNTADQFLKVELDKDGNNNFVPIGTMPFMAVPYALYAVNGGTGGGNGGGTTVSIKWLGTLTNPPVSPTAGQAYYNSTDKKSYIYDSTGTAQILAQDGTDGTPGPALSWLGAFTAEPTPTGANQAYYNMTDRKAYIYDGSAWMVFSESGTDGQNGVGTGVSWLGSLPTAPADPTINQAYYNTADKKSYIFDSTSTWQILAQDGNDGTSGVSGSGISWLGALATVPATPLFNQAYYNTADKKSYIYDSTGTWQILAQDGNDGTSGASGTSISWQGTLAAAPATPTLNMAYYNSTDRKAYVYDSTGTWQILAQDGIGWNLAGLEFKSDGSIGITTTANPDTLKSGNRAWLIRGNSETNPALDFIGTTDDNPFIFKAGGTGTQFERMRIFPDKPQIIINGTDDGGTSLGKGVFTVFSGDHSTGIINDQPIYSNAIIGYANSGTGAGVAGYNASNGYGVKGFTQVGSGIYGIGTTRFNEGVRGYNSSTSGGLGVIGMTNSPYKATNSFRSGGVLGMSTHGSGVGVVGAGNNVDYQTVTNTPEIGAGVMGLGTRAGAIGFGTNATNGIGVMGVGNNQVTVLPGHGGAGVVGVAGGAASTPYAGVGVLGFAKGNATDVVERWGGVFEFGTSAAKVHVYTYLAGANSTGLYGLISNGTKSTVVKDKTGENRLLFCTEAPEVLFQDFGTGELTNGAAHIELEDLLAKVIRVDAKHPMKVFIQLEGECNGVFVTNKSAKGFDVKELQGGKSNVPFTWQIVASRADEVLPDGTVLPYSERRFPVGPGPLDAIDLTPSPDSIATPAAKPALKAADLKKNEKEVINTAFSNLQFSSAKADISASSLPSLDKMAALLLSHPEWQLLLSGHTDNEGTEAFNQTLSEKRSEAVRQYLVSKGVGAERVTTKGYGQSKPLAANSNKAGKDRNRRVEMEIFTEEKP
ncbi:OmpA family protein [Chitinophaga rhizophila]|uniref:OmpA family protein n=1 Tax=Chitinophaga rhizophila TaxID=2866212 RepID=A0ABS7GGM5_9BACT|nr:OmpA family protein [Chitinophaga rhizophila]MBW8686839.1 OmpA family protein [Chitinophaga rhizophila]